MRISPLSRQNFTAIQYVINNSMYDRDIMAETLRKNESCKNGSAVVILANNMRDSNNLIYLTGRDATDYFELRDAASNTSCSDFDHKYFYSCIPHARKLDLRLKWRNPCCAFGLS